MNLHDFVAYDKNTNAKTHSSLLFINVESDGGSVSIHETLKNLEEDYHICPFTGLKDKNGTKIYEGSILAYQRGTDNINGEFREKYYGGIFIKVIYNSEIGRFESDKSIRSSHKDLRDVLRYNFVVVGNVFQNPELLN